MKIQPTGTLKSQYIPGFSFIQDFYRQSCLTVIGEIKFSFCYNWKGKKNSGHYFFFIRARFPNRPSCTADVRKFKDCSFSMWAACENLLYHAARALVSQSHSERVMCLSQIELLLICDLSQQHALYCNVRISSNLLPFSLVLNKQ